MIPVVQCKDWEACKAELSPLEGRYSELLMLYEADVAKLSEHEHGTGAANEEAASLRAKADQYAAALKEVSMICIYSKCYHSKFM